MITEGDSATITCEKSTSKRSQAHWILTGSDLLQNWMQVVNDTVESVELKNGMMLDIELNASASLLDIGNGMERFGITISNLTPDLSGLTVRCVVCWEEENTCQPYHQAAVVAVIPKNMSKAVYIDFSAFTVRGFTKPGYNNYTLTLCEYIALQVKTHNLTFAS